jgi:hypothetical protein
MALGLTDRGADRRGHPTHAADTHSGVVCAARAPNPGKLNQASGKTRLFDPSERLPAAPRSQIAIARPSAYLGIILHFRIGTPGVIDLRNVQSYNSFYSYQSILVVPLIQSFHNLLLQTILCHISLGGNYVENRFPLDLFM